MALYRLETKHITRGKTRPSTAAAAYQSATRIMDTRTDQSFSYESKKGVLHTEIITPDGSKIDRSDLWNLAELSEKRKDARTAREYILALPHELPTEKRIKLAQEFTAYLVKKHSIAADLAIHAPSKDGDQRNFHAHILATTRTYKNGNLGPKNDFELGDKDRKKKGLGKAADELIEIREKFETIINKYLEEAKTGKTVSSKSLKARGIRRRPTMHLGPRLAALERKGIRTRKGDYNRLVQEINKIETEESQISQELTLTHEEISRLETEIQNEIAVINAARHKQEKEPEKNHHADLYKAYKTALAKRFDLPDSPEKADPWIAYSMAINGMSESEITQAIFHGSPKGGDQTYAEAKAKTGIINTRKQAAKPHDGQSTNFTAPQQPQPTRPTRQTRKKRIKRWSKYNDTQRNRQKNHQGLRSEKPQ